MNEKIIEIIADVLGVDKKELLENFDTSELWDSLRRVEVLFTIEEEFDITFSEDELIELTTPKKLCDSVMRKADN